MKLLEAKESQGAPEPMSLASHKDMDPIQRTLVGPRIYWNPMSILDTALLPIILTVSHIPNAPPSKKEASTHTNRAQQGLIWPDRLRWPKGPDTLLRLARPTLPRLQLPV